MPLESPSTAGSFAIRCSFYDSKHRHGTVARRRFGEELRSGSTPDFALIVCVNAQGQLLGLLATALGAIDRCVAALGLGRLHSIADVRYVSLAHGHHGTIQGDDSSGNLADSGLSPATQSCGCALHLALPGDGLGQ